MTTLSRSSQPGQEGRLVIVYGQELASRLLLGTALYPSPSVMAQSIRVGKAGAVTASIRRESVGKAQTSRRFWDQLLELRLPILPNTAGCQTVKEAVTTAHMAREIFNTIWIKLEVIGEQDTLQPDVFGLVEAARILNEEGFQVFPYTTEDLVVAERLLSAGCRVLMPWGAPIGSARGLNNAYGLRTLRAHFPDIPIIVDAGLGVPSHASQAMELGCDGILLNTAVAKAVDPPQMALAFSKAVEAGRLAFLSGALEPRDMAHPSSPIVGRPLLAGQ
ncbi:thiazole synthase [Hyphomicrobium sp. CS1GBMeth3]|uniref:thiazole synthase n=1 Tax=Hyphomicrobium sp. CS1GBMeth3 TaxID=1892845 RepID=UPI0009307588|nr:thiazole synthase [Hyphomicrobium sp. CS1GBMeth3]